MKHYPMSPAREVRLGERELISAGQEILTRTRMLAEALVRKVEASVNQNAGARSATTRPRQPPER